MYGCAGDSSINMCGGLGYINIFHTDAHTTTIDDWGCGNILQDTYYHKWYDDMGHCGVTPGKPFYQYQLVLLSSYGTLIGIVRGNHPETIGCQDFEAECALLKEVSDAGHVR